MTTDPGVDPQRDVWRGRVRQCLMRHSRNREVVPVANRLGLVLTPPAPEYHWKPKIGGKEMFFRDTPLVRLLDFRGHRDVLPLR